MALLLRSAIPVWAVCALCAVAVALWVPAGDYLTVLPVALGLVTLLTLGVQLATGRAEGYILRVSVTTAGSVIVLAAATVLLLPAALAAA